MNNICVFCGSSKGNDTQFESAARVLGKLIAKNNMRLVYGGGNVGLMGAVADSVINHGGKVTGVIPEFLLKKEVGHNGLTELIVVDSMHERKQKMAALADGFIALPGGFGTLEELAEIITWVQLNLIVKPVGLLNIAGYYDHLLAQTDIMQNMGFTSPANRKILKSHTEPEALLHMLMQYAVTEGKAPDLKKT